MRWPWQRRSPATDQRTPDEIRQQWIACVVDMCAHEALRPEPNYTAAHWIFLRKVLGFSVDEAGHAYRLAHHRLTRAECERIAREWWVCEGCGEPVHDPARNWCAAHDPDLAAISAWSNEEDSAA